LLSLRGAIEWKKRMIDWTKKHSWTNWQFWWTNFKMFSIHL